MTDPSARESSRRSSAPAHRVRRGGGSLRRWPRRVLITVNVFVALALLGAGGAYAYVTYQFDQIHRIHIDSLEGASTPGSPSVSGGSVPAGAPFTMLVVGSDSRSSLSAADKNQFGSGSVVAGQRSDTTMLVRVVPATHQLMIMSVPRDLWVPIAGMGNQRINAAFDKGPDLLVSTIEAQLGIPINHYVEVNFDSFRQITDAVGGIKFYFPTPARDVYSGLRVYQAGCVSLTGDQALGFARSREYEYYNRGEWHHEAESDLARIQRQQAFVKKMLAKAQGQYTNPLALNGIISGVTSNLTLDTGFSKTLMLSLAKEFRTVNAAGIPSETLPTFNKTVGGGQVLGLQQPEAQQIIAAFNNLGVAPPAPGATTTTALGSPTSLPTTTSTLVKPSSVAIEVVNGSGVAGQAGKAVSELTTAGYRASINASSRAYVTATQIGYAPSSLSAAQQLAGQISGGATLVPDSTLSDTGFNLKLVTGAGFGGVTASVSGTSSTVPATTSTTAAHGATAATVPVGPPAPYMLPGTPTGQPPPADC